VPLLGRPPARKGHRKPVGTRKGRRKPAGMRKGLRPLATGGEERTTDLASPDLKKCPMAVEA